MLRQHLHYGRGLSHDDLSFYQHFEVELRLLDKRLTLLEGMLECKSTGSSSRSEDKEMHLVKGASISRFVEAACTNNKAYL